MKDGKAGQKNRAERGDLFLLALSGGQGDGSRGTYCIRCAVSNPDFRERAPLTYSAPFDEAQPRAWIEGRAYSLRRHPVPGVRCACCDDEAPVTYFPDDADVRTP